jgi:D-hydroxyproline dehydrogenase subunit beta
MNPDVVIIGGGIAGCACAYYLSLFGQRVHLLERGPLGSGASRAGMSHVVTWEEPEAHLELARASQRLYQRLCRELPDDIEYRQTGSIAVVDTPDGMASFAAMVGRLQIWGLDCQLLDSADLLRLEPALAPGLAGGAYFPGDGQVNPLYTTQSLARAAREQGALIRTQVEVTGIEVRAGCVQAVITTSGRIPTGAVVIAAGAWSGALGQMAGIEIPIQPRKGILVVTAPVPEDMLRCKVILSAGYMDSIKAGGGGAAVAANVQQVKNGNLLLGSSRQFSGFDLRVDPAVAGEIIRRCLRFLPRLANLTAVRMWAGLRPYTPDLLPIIGPVSNVAGLYVAAGHEGIGITEGPITGLLISQMITGQPVEVPVEALSPDRFQNVRS